jgi:membrane associated rhomboid family serine protease
LRPVVFAILLLNSAVFAAWVAFGEHPFMIDNFLVSWDGLMAGRIWTLLTSEFSHVLLVHFFLNMYVLSSFGPIVEETIGSGRFFVFYMVAAIIASLSHAGVSAFALGQPGLPALGASGAISGVVLLFSLTYPRARLLLLGLIPLPALAGALLFVSIDIVGLIAQFEGGGLPIGHGAHLGGAATGLLYYLIVIAPLQMRQPARVDFGDVATWRRIIAQHRRPR